MSVLAKGWAAADPATNHDRGARAVSDFRYRMANAGTSGLVLFAIVGSVILLATVNVAHLLMARALARGPGVLLLDEPLAALDAHTKSAVRAELHDLQVLRFVPGTHHVITRFPESNDGGSGGFP